MFKDITELAEAKAIITIQGQEMEVRKLTVKELQEYKKIVNRSMGTVNANLGTNNQKLDMNVEKVDIAQHEADKYLIEQTFKEEEIGDEDINQLYNLFNPLVDELKRINDINEVSNKQIEEALKN